jgi:hypothetical protein
MIDKQDSGLVSFTCGMDLSDRGESAFGGFQIQKNTR